MRKEKVVTLGSEGQWGSYDDQINELIKKGNFILHIFTAGEPPCERVFVLIALADDEQKDPLHVSKESINEYLKEKPPADSLGVKISHSLCKEWKSSLDLVEELNNIARQHFFELHKKSWIKQFGINSIDPTIGDYQYHNICKDVFGRESYDRHH